MSIGWPEALKLLGFGTPLIWAAAVYSFFHFLDKKASEPAKRAISDWFKPLPYDRAAVAAALVEVFDRVYTRPLFGWRAILRSSFLTIVISVVFAYSLYLDILKRGLLIGVVFWPALITNIVSDYISLFLLRRWLVVAGNRPFFALMTGALVGAFVIVVCYFIRDTVIFFMMSGSNFITTYGWLYVQRWMKWSLEFKGLNERFLVPAVAVHLWLPLFALGVAAIQLLNWFFKAVGWMQWFLKQGRHHPLQAIGYVAATIVFVGTAVAQIVR